MTPERRAAETRRKSAERQRRREAGYKRVECWLSERDIARLNGFGPTPSEAIVMLLDVEEIGAKRRMKEWSDQQRAYLETQERLSGFYGENQ